MDGQNLSPNNPSSGNIEASESLDSAGIDNMRVSDLSSSQSVYPVESIEVKEAPKPDAAPHAAHQFYASSFSKRRALIVSACITVAITLLTGGSIVFFNKGVPTSRSTNKPASSDVALKGAALQTLPETLQTQNESLLVNGDIITRGEIKISNGNFVTILRAQGANADQTFTLPNGSGTICLNSNNCSFASQTGLNTTNATLSALQNQLNNIGDFVTPDIPAASLVNNQAGTVSLQGTTNQITVSTNNGTIILSTPQDLASISSPTFANLALTNNFSLSGVVTLPIDCTTNANGGALTTNALGQIICSDDTSGALTAITSNTGGTAGTIPVFTASHNIENSLLSQATGTVTTNGNSVVTGTATFSSLATFNGGLAVQTGDTFTVNGDGFTDLTGVGLTVSSGSLQTTLGTSVDLTVEVTGTLPIANGGTGITTVPTNGQVLVGNGTGYTAANITNAGGVGITNGAGTLSLAVLYGSAANTAVQGNINLTCAAGTGNLSGGGNSFALGTGGACDDLTITNSPSFTTSVTTPQLILTGAGSNATLQTASIGQPTTYILPDSGGASTIICIISNNCNYQVAGDYVSLQNSTPGTAQTGNINIDGTIIAGNLSGVLNGVTVSNTGTSQFMITGGSPTSRTLTVTNDVSLNQSLLTTSSVTFNQITLTSALSVGNGGTGISSAPANGNLLIGNGGSFSLASLSSADSSVVITNGAGTIDLSVPSAGTCSGCANVSLNNLSGVAINTSLLAGAATVDLGSTTAAFRDLYLHGTGSFGTNSFRITGVPSGNRTITLPSLDGTVVLAQTIGSSTQQTGDINLSGTVIAGTAIQGILYKSADSAGVTSSITIRSGNSSGNTSGNITMDVGTAGTTAGTISIGANNATGLTLGRSGVITSLPGGINTVNANIATGTGTINGQTISSSANFTGSVAVGTSLTVNTITPTSTLTVGTTSQDIIVQGTDTTITSTAGANMTSLIFETPTANVTYTLESAAAGSYEICTSAGNCTGGGSVVTEVNSTVGRFTYFSDDTEITSSNVEQTDADTVTLIGNSSALVIQGGTAGGSGSASLVLGNNPNTTGSIQFFNEGDTGSVILASGTVAAADSYTLKLPTTLDTSGKCLNVGAGGQIGYFSCVSSGGGGGAGVTGTGTTNQLVRWTNGGLSVVGDSVIQDNGSRVGINISPDATAILRVGTSGVFKVTNSGDTTTAALTVSSGGASINGGLDNTNDGITNAGAISGVTTLTASGLLHTTATNQALTVSGTPGPNATQSLIEIGNAIAGGNNTANGGTYIGLNAPNSGAGSNADFLHFQKNGVSELLITNTGDITAGRLNGVALAQGASQFTVNGGTGTARTLTVTGDSTINQDLSTTSNTVAFGRINSLTTKLETSQGGTGSNLSGSLAGAVAIFNATTDKFESARLRSSDNSLTINSADGDIDLVVQSCTTCANTSLSNLTGTTAINSDLLAQAGNSLGSANSPFQNLFIYGGGTYGSHSFELTGTPTGNRTLSLPDVTATVCVSTNNCNYQAAGNYVLLSPVSQQTGYINVSGNIAGGTINNLTLAANADGFSVSGGTTPRTLTVTNAAVTLNQSLQTTDSVTFNSLSTSTITTAAASTANAISVQPGTSTAANGSGANLTLKGGDQSGTTCNATNCTGGSVTVQGGNANGASGTTRNGGNVTIDAGIGASANGSVSIGASNAIAVNVGRSVGATTIQGNASSAITITNGANSTSIQFVNPTASVIYRFDAASAGTYTVCTTANLTGVCAPGSGSGNYIQNQFAAPQTANFSIQSANAAQVTAVVMGAASQSVDILQVATSSTTVFNVSSTGNVRVGSATTDAAANLFVVDSFNGDLLAEGALSAVNGSMYYNTNSSRFRCYQAGAWKDCDVSSNVVSRNKKVILTPEYAGATFEAVGGSNVGYMTSAFDSTQRESYYMWSTSETTAQNYDIIVQIPLPSDFNGFNGATPITIDRWTSNITSGTITAQLQDTTGTNVTNWNTCSLTPGSANTWTTTAGCTIASGTYAADGILTLRLNITAAPSGGTTRVGNITLNYTSAY